MRNPRRLVPLALLFLLLVTFSHSTFAQGEPPAPPPPAAAPPAAAPPAVSPEVEKRKEEAKARFLKGLELVQNESWDAALAEFLASRELYPTKVALKNAAVSLRQLKRNAEALEMYRELLREFGSSVTPDEKKTIDDAILQLQSSVGEIQVESSEPESTVVIDGQQSGTTPLKGPIVVNAGTHSVRVSKEGYETFETQVLVAGGQRKSVQAKLKALSRVGTLVVREADGRALEVVVDGAVVGKTPQWQGQLAVGVHTVYLRGENDLGTPPSSATVHHNQTSTLSLRATKLDAAIRIEPTPSNARVDVDGVQVGNGVWEGRLKSGTHKVEVVALGFVPYRRDVVVNSGQREVLTVALERDLSHPMWSAGFVPHVYVEVLGGPAFAGSLGGRADGACAEGECEDRSRPFGFLAGARGGYQLSRGLGIELFLGYLQLNESMTRRVAASADGRAVTSNDYADETKLAGPLGALSASYQFFETTPLTFRVGVGVARVTGTFSNKGTFSGEVPNPCLDPKAPDCDGTVYRFSENTSVPEKSARVWMPFVAPEARFGYRFSKRLMVDLGVAVFLMFPPDAPRTGLTSLSGREGERKTSLRDVPDAFPDGNDARPGVLALRPENGLGSFVAIIPTIAGRFDF
jgi:hypothetical protein